jgi:transposase
MIHPKMKYTYVGIDSHKGTHYAVFLNCFYEKLGEVEFNNYPNAFDEFLSKAKELKQEGTTLLFGLEDVSAYGRTLTVYLIKNNYTVKHVNASLVAHERKSLNTLTKTDSFDSECAARVLLNRFDSLPDADPNDKYFVLSQLVVRRRSIVKITTALKNHLHALLMTNYPSYQKYFSKIEYKTTLAFYEKYPSPSTLKDVTAEELEAFLKEISATRNWSKKAKQILDLVKKDGDTSTEHQDIRNLAIQSAIRQIKSNLEEIQQMDILLESFLENFDYKLTSMKGIDTVMAANLIAEIGDIERFQNPAKLARYSGVAPVIYASGKTNLQFANERGNRVLKSIFFNLAALMIVRHANSKKILNPFFYNYYHKKISEGKTKKQALKCVERRLVNIIWSMMKHKTEYINPPSIDLEENS